ncbi:MAG: glutathione S-transferase family protein, partial [Rhodospirillaceae bacterium]|nr:glutathione S-transferase family protein [Rhodospirillaceae bacterium]
MRTLYHHPLSPFARRIRLMLAEKRLAFAEVVQDTWREDAAFLKLNPAGDVPVLVEEDGSTLADENVIAEYLEDAYPEPRLIGTDPRLRAEARRLTAWFDRDFSREVTQAINGELLVKRVVAQASPDIAALKAGRARLPEFLAQMQWLLDRRRWLAGDELSIADLAAGAHVSLVDYCGEVPWDGYAIAKEWYVRLKSRPSFRALLRDVLP